MSTERAVLCIVVGVSVGCIFGYAFSEYRSEHALGENVLRKNEIRQSTTDGFLQYSHPSLGFSLAYPAYLEVSEYNEGEGARTILFQHPEKEEGFQIFVVPYSQAEVDAKRIQKDIPSGVVKEPLEVVIGNNITATAFWSESPIVGETREVWFVHNGYLYEVTTYAKLDSLLAEILDTLVFK